MRDIKGMNGKNLNTSNVANQVVKEKPNVQQQTPSEKKISKELEKYKPESEGPLDPMGLIAGISLSGSYGC
jgi:hypothetical protein